MSSKLLNFLQFKQKLQHQSYDFEEMSLLAFELNFDHNPIYQEFCSLLKKTKSDIHKIEDIPFLPIEFFKNHKISANQNQETHIFTSSGTSGSTNSKHYVYDIDFYLDNCTQIFEASYNTKLEDCVFLFLLPSYLERSGSSLIAMAQHFIEQSKNTNSGFYLNDYSSLTQKINSLKDSPKQVFLIGVSFGLLDYLESKPSLNHHQFITMETGGMKGRRKELTRTELHQCFDQYLKQGNYHSEYGMTELLSQAYSTQKGIFKQNNRLRAYCRDLKDPLSLNKTGSGALNLIDLANIESCCFIASSDQGKVNESNFEVMGRIDHSDIRGCNLMTSDL